ncbi:hypothetical protein [Ornithinimicrobium kibberense]|uniref:hypothetical protein n=1 Tax=Ornithinimicrobium kibberense TaxID=282060 RepID=UPI003612BC4B
MHRPGVGPGQAQEHPDGRGLARAVGAEEAVHATRGDVEVEPLDGDAAAADPRVGLAQSARDDRHAVGALRGRGAHPAPLRAGRPAPALSIQHRVCVREGQGVAACPLSRAGRAPGPAPARGAVRPAAAPRRPAPGGPAPGSAR